MRLFLEKIEVLSSHQAPIQIIILIQTGGHKFTILGGIGLSQFLEGCTGDFPKVLFLLQ